MSHVSFYRKWRPQTFADVIGQDRVTRTLANAITANRIVHAYLFSGHRGTGKTTTARILAKALNCERGPTATPCNVCAACRAIGGGVSLDVIEIDAASNRGIDEIRDLREKVKLVPVEGRYKVYIIDEAHMLTAEAANALLKTLEEPPPHAVFILVTTEPHRLPATITSRTQRFDFRRIPQAAIVDRLRTIAASEGITVDDEALQLIARSADGALRDAESVLDQLSAFCQGRVTKADVLSVLGLIEEEVAQQVTDAVIAGDAAACLEIANRVIAEGRDVRQILRSLVEHFRDLLVVAVVRDPQDIVESGENRLAVLRAQSARLAPGAILQKIRILTAAEAEARFATQPRVVLEMALLKLSRPEMDASIDGLAARLEALEHPEGREATAKAADVERPLGPRKPEAAPPPRRAPRDRGPQGGADAVEAALPASASAEAASPGQPHAGIDIELVRARWEQLMDAVKQRTRSVHAFLLESAPQAVEGNDLVLAVRHKFHLENLRDDKNRRLVEELLGAVLGTSLRLRPVLGEAAALPGAPAGGAPPAATAPGGPSAAAPPAGDALVQEAVRRFGNPVQEIRQPE